MMFSTLNESSLHRSLKILYAQGSGGAVEQEIEGKICDVLTPQGEIIEIQTGNLSKLAPKVAGLIDRYPIKIVFPVATQKIIRTVDSAGETLSERRSPKKLTVYSIFREITGLYPWLFHKNFSIEALPVTVREIRVAAEGPVQSLNRRRRFLRAWNKADKALVSYGKPMVFKTPQDYLALLPVRPGDEFSVRDLRRSPAGRDAPLALWVLNKCGLIREKRRVGNTRLYELA